MRKRLRPPRRACPPISCDKTRRQLPSEAQEDDKRRDAGSREAVEEIAVFYQRRWALSDSDQSRFFSIWALLLLPAFLLREFGDVVHTSAQLLRTKVAIALSQTAINKNLIGPFECSRQKVCRRFKLLPGLSEMLSVGASPIERDPARAICLEGLETQMPIAAALSVCLLTTLSDSHTFFHSGSAAPLPVTQKCKDCLV